MKNVMVSRELFIDLCLYHLAGDTDREADIRKQLRAKLDAITLREQYAKSKTAATPEERERARQAYLDGKGIPESFRW